MDKKKLTLIILGVILWIGVSVFITDYFVFRNLHHCQDSHCELEQTICTRFNCTECANPAGQPGNICMNYRPKTLGDRIFFDSLGSLLTAALIGLCCSIVFHMILLIKWLICKIIQFCRPNPTDDIKQPLMSSVEFAT